MRRLMRGLVPAALVFATAGVAGAQTRTAPSIGDVVRRAPARVETRPGVTGRVVQIPAYGCDDRVDGRYDRNGRERSERDREAWERAERDRRAREERDSRYGSSNRGSGTVNGTAGCCADDRYGSNGRDPRNGTRGTLGNGSGTVDARRGNGSGSIAKTGVTGNGRVNPNANARNGCGYDDRGDDRDHKDKDHKDKDHKDNDRRDWDSRDRGRRK